MCKQERKLGSFIQLSAQEDIYKNILQIGGTMYNCTVYSVVNPIPAGGGGQFDPPPVVFFT